MTTATFLPDEILDTLTTRMAHLRDASILVTGGTGFVGRHLIPLLLRAGAHVTCFARPGSDTSRLPENVTLIRGDIMSGNGLAQAMSDRDIVIHMAAVLFSGDWRDYLRGNAGAAESIAGAWRLLDKARHAPKRLIFVSSLSASGPSALAPGKTDVDAEDGVDRPVSAYGWSKLFAEHILYRAAGERLVVLRPPIIYGSGDHGLLPLFKSISRGVAVLPGRNRAFPVSAIHVVDAAQAVMLCCRPDAYGWYHISDGHVYSIEQFCRAMGKALGRAGDDLRVINVPLWLAGLSARLCGAGARLLSALSACCGKRHTTIPRWNEDKFREAREDGWLCDDSRIKGELEFFPVVSELSVGMEEAVKGYRAEGLL